MGTLVGWRDEGCTGAQGRNGTRRVTVYARLEKRKVQDK